MIHVQSKTYGLPPHLLARCTLDELRFNNEVLNAGAEMERRLQSKNAPRGGGAHTPNRMRRR